MRREKNLSYARLGRRARSLHGISRTSTHAILHGRLSPSDRRLRLILHLCGVSDFERDIWLAEFHRIQTPPPPQTILQSVQPPVARWGTQVEPVVPAIMPPAPKSASGWPTLGTRTRRHGSRKEPLHRAHWLLVVMTPALPVGVITLTLHGASEFFISVLLGLASLMVSFVFAAIRERPDRDHRRPNYLEDDDNIFGLDHRAAPPVIGL
ncbi:helix-turn-helix domain-containing protein [Saccharothrix longispora]|uniref:Helix-turn-helix protein n=1 Tax=Saccharothrix longispora TaxID=33920 RepID=A0ABU1PPC3_9PSEU|nr:helix-turn-helix transcriptional regulator [Saccharothrix longispora]MDR6592520.1 hypothetical protein [Saccharothrix longispora]